MNDGRTTAAAAVEDIFPYLCVRDAATAIAFYKRAFGAQEDTAPYDTLIATVQGRADAEVDRLPKAVKKVRKAARRL